MTHQTFGEYLRTKREQAGLSQGSVSKSLGYQSPQFISNWERGISKPPARTLAKIVRLYRLDREELIESLVQNTKKSLELAFGSSLKKSGRKSFKARG